MATRRSRTKGIQMRLTKMEIAGHQLEQYTFRLNIKEIESLFTSLELTRQTLGKNPQSTHLKELSRHTSIARRELARAMKESKKMESEK
jgi:hypothetical protein